jgi:hypothetical protein
VPTEGGVLQRETKRANCAPTQAPQRLPFVFATCSLTAEEYGHSEVRTMDSWVPICFLCDRTDMDYTHGMAPTQMPPKMWSTVLFIMMGWKIKNTLSAKLQVPHDIAFVYKCWAVLATDMILDSDSWSVINM